MKRHPLDKPILRHLFAGFVYHHKLKEQDQMNREINSVLDDLKKKDPQLKIEKLRNALSNLVRINEIHNKAVGEIIDAFEGKPLDWKDEYLDEARAVLEETK
jgi:hypothetical protein